MLTSLTTPWPLLRQLRRFTLEIAAYMDGGIDYYLLGHGTLQVSEETAARYSRVLWLQTGTWTAGPKRGCPFKRGLAWRRWTSRPGIQLSPRPRRGEGTSFRTTFLGSQPGLWVAIDGTGHWPGYQIGALEWDAKRLRLVWEVQRPQDPYRLTLEATHT
jgi:hypothetical protein